MHELSGHILTISFIESLKNADRWLFRKINQDWTTPFLDVLFPLWREAITWMPLYIFLLAVVLLNFGFKIWPWIIGFIVTVSLTDQVSSHVFKNAGTKTEALSRSLSRRQYPTAAGILLQQLQLYFVSCYQSFWNGLLHLLYHEKVFWELDLCFFLLGFHHQLWTGLHRHPLPARCNRWRLTGYRNRLDNRIYI